MLFFPVPLQDLMYQQPVVIKTKLFFGINQKEGLI